MSSLEAARGVLRDVFGYSQFRPGQAEIIASVLEGRNTLAILPTGGGKSLCYQIPALMSEGTGLVVSPLISLMRDQVAALEGFGVAAASLSSGNAWADNQVILERLDQGELRLLYLSPERLLNGDMIARLKAARLSLIAVDEAHCMSQWGHDFRKDYLGLARLPELFPGTPLMALTATADEATRGDIIERLFRGEAETFVSGFDRPNIRFGVTPKRDTRRQVLDFVRTHEGSNGIVYCLSRRKTDEMAQFLCAEGFTALPYHAGMEKDLRQAHQDRFIHEDGVVIVATIAFGMGIDKPDVRFVAHADLPGSVENYYQEIGRAGRDGAPAEAVMFYGLNDIHLRRRMIQLSEKPEEAKIVDRQRLNALLAICEATTCRRQALLAYFAESIDPCGNCDLCLNPVEVADGTVEAQKVLSAVYRTGQRFGAAHIIDVLRGKETPKVAKFGHDRLPTFGVGADRSAAAWYSVIRQMLAAGHVGQDLAGHGGLALTDTSRPLLRGEMTFSIGRETPVAARRAGSKREKTGPTVAAVDLSASDHALFDELKALRMELARENGVPAYVIFPDRTLIEMARRRPGTMDELAEIHGVGAAKLERFGEVFLEILSV